MINDMTVMLYVADVPKTVEFWEAMGFEEVLRQRIGMKDTSLLKYSESGAAIQLYDLEFIRMYQPDRASNKTSLLFSAETLDELYKAAQRLSKRVTPISPYGDLSVFSFDDPEGNTFSVTGEIVDIEASPADLAAFDENVSKLEKLPLDSIENLEKAAIIFFGRKTCPWSRHMAKEFPFLHSTIYFVDTEGTEASHPVRQQYQVETVPTLIKRASTGQFVKYDKKRESVASFVGEA